MEWDLNSPLIEQYRLLPETTRRTLQFWSIHHEPIGRHQFPKLIPHLNNQVSKEFCLQFKDINAVVASLISNGLLFDPKMAGMVVHKDLQDYVVQDSIRDKTFEPYATFVQSDRVSYQSFQTYGYWGRRIRDLRIAFYRNDVDAIGKAKLLTPVDLAGSEHSCNVLNPFNQEIFGGLAATLQNSYLKDVLSNSYVSGFGDKQVVQLAAAFPFELTDADGPLVSMLCSVYLASGDSKALQELASKTNGRYLELIACQSLLAGNWGQALIEFEIAIKSIRKTTGRRKIAIDQLPGVMHALLYFSQKSTVNRKKISDIADVMIQDWPDEYDNLGSLLRSAIKFQEGIQSSNTFSVWLIDRVSMRTNLLTNLVAFYLWSWLVPESNCPVKVQDLQEMESKYRSLGFYWLQSEATKQLALLNAVPTNSINSATTPEEVALALEISQRPSLLEMIQAEPVWLRPLSALRKLVESNTVTTNVSNERLVWEFQSSVSDFKLVPFIQKKSKLGWTVGQRVSLKRLYESQTAATPLACLTDQDRALILTLQPKSQFDRYDRYPETTYEFKTRPAAEALIGHPLIFSATDRNQQIEIVKREPNMLVQRYKGMIRICLEPVPNESDVLFIPEAPNRVGLCIFSPRHREIHRIIGNELLLPDQGLPAVVETLQSIATLIPIHSEISGMAASGEAIEADPRTHLHLSRKGDGMAIQMHVQPFGADGPYYRPGIGSKNLMTEIQGKTMSTKRSFKDELACLHKIFEWCPILESETSIQLDFELGSIEESLEFLLQLKPLVDSQQVTVYWPHGKSIRVSKEASPAMMQLHIKKDRDWFAVSGLLQVDQGLTVDMMKLIELIESSPLRFVALDDGQFLALTDELRRKLNQLKMFSERRQDKLRFPSIRIAALEDINEVFSIRADAHWKKCVERWKDSNTLTLTLPDTFQGELRDYQLEGFQWLGRLAAWGAGACLADDMGLGKTIQALALLLHRAADGPALVVAPTSVCFNWIREANRFAPTLNVRQFGGGDRDAFFNNLGPRDLMVCSYGLLNSEAERFQKQPWHTLLLDEAQAIKNFATKRSQTVMNLQADFRIIMTGTPLENHLGEVWNLFHFINPGLLGSHEQFQKQFAIPIERDQCRATQGALKRLIQPFILRRTKTQVLDELPSRTEVTVHIELSEDEKALYEAIRQRAVKKLAEAQDTAKRGESQYLQMLAEIMKLRRACCHPQLVLEGSQIASAKLTQFSETIDELIENRHKVLVFSQFVGHLEILRAELDRKKVAYQYLDGSTPAKDRQVRVDAFQSGQGDVFLISLKAGGTGLNLTAADYVIHMDPWWNPAVEDQASDRAHRMGQKRPVTIYRFVCRGTIEERILELHARKRDLADGLLEGTELTGKLSAEELMRLIRFDG